MTRNGWVTRSSLWFFAVALSTPLLGGADGCIEEQNPAAPFTCLAGYTLTIERGETRALPNLCGGGATTSIWDANKFELKVGATPAGVTAEVAVVDGGITLGFAAKAEAALGDAAIDFAVRLRDSACDDPAAASTTDCLQPIALVVKVVEPGARPPFEVAIAAKVGGQDVAADGLVALGARADLSVTVTGAVGPVDIVWDGISLYDGSRDSDVYGTTSDQVTTAPLDYDQRVYRAQIVDQGATPPVTVVADVILGARASWTMGPISTAIPTYPGAEFDVSIPEPAAAPGGRVYLERAAIDDTVDPDRVLESAFLQATTTWTAIVSVEGCTRFESGEELAGATGLFRLVFDCEIVDTMTQQTVHARYVQPFKREY